MYLVIQPPFSLRFFEMTKKELEAYRRKRSPEEMDDIRAKMTFPVEISEQVLSDKTLSLAVDVGMYFAQVVLKNVPGTHWGQPLGSKKFIDYGQPVIMGLHTPLNPVRIATVTAQKISKSKRAELLELYDIWTKK